MNKTALFMSSLDCLQRKSIPPSVYVRAKNSLLDFIAVCAAGAKFQETRLNKCCEFFKQEVGSCNAIGSGKKLCLKEVVFLNGLNGHALDYDDGTNAGIIHLGSPIFSLLLPLAQVFNVSLRRLLWAAVIGYETSYTIAITIQPRHKAMGYHATGTCGVLGATIAASYMLDFTEEERFNAFGAACVSATGMLSVLDDGAELKPYNVAKAALLALTSLQMAKAGFKCNPDPLGGHRGFLKLLGGSSDIEIKPLMQDDTYAIMKSYTKPYASCRYTHPAIEAAIKINQEQRLEIADIASVVVRTYELAVSGHDHIVVPVPSSAKMSIPYSVAVALFADKAGLVEFNDQHIQDEAILALTARVKVIADEGLSAIFPAMQSAIVDITTKSGMTYSKRVDFPKGEPENPLTEEEFYDRYCELMAYACKETKFSQELYEIIMSNEPDMKRLYELI